MKGILPHENWELQKPSRLVGKQAYAMMGVVGFTRCIFQAKNTGIDGKKNKEPPLLIFVCIDLKGVCHVYQANFQIVLGRR